MRKMSDYEKTVRIALITHDMSMTDLAKELGISKTYLYDIVVGSRVSEAYKKRIAQILGLVYEDECDRKNCEDAL